MTTTPTTGDPMTTLTCPRCATRWHQAGNRTGHCSGCHRTFSGIATFDAHQRIRDGLVCLDPADLTTADGPHVCTVRFPDGGEHLFIGELLEVLPADAQGAEDEIDRLRKERDAHAVRALAFAKERVEIEGELAGAQIELDKARQERDEALARIDRAWSLVTNYHGLGVPTKVLAGALGAPLDDAGDVPAVEPVVLPTTPGCVTWPDDLVIEDFAEDMLLARRLSSGGRVQIRISGEPVALNRNEVRRLVAWLSAFVASEAGV